ncbi:CidA/LrgA family protein [Agathobaculum sp.]|uniref:CidA/LrgA family protein n=1 Tax=Agathobaculum sp. TaxID=2048138 RepID=UPI002A82059E|nr:CidA/LrgA family protein [Agathobaculum sp.]MDY3617872.1 CidA/LrgA family protein [Agathobaculum sp.]
MNYLKQLGVLLACCIAGEALSILLQRRLPGNVLGMALLLLCLVCGVIRLSHVERTADFLLQNMAFLFLPACLGVLEIFADIQSEIAAIIAVCVLTTLCTAAATALTVHVIFKRQRRGGKEASNHD